MKLVPDSGEWGIAIGRSVVMVVLGVAAGVLLVTALGWLGFGDRLALIVVVAVIQIGGRAVYRWLDPFDRGQVGTRRSSDAA